MAANKRRIFRKGRLAAAVIAAAVVLWFLFSFFLPQDVFAYSNGYDIKHIDVDITVDEDNTYHVVETISAWYEEGAGKHGIIRRLPLRNSIYREDGSQGRTRAEVSDIYVDAPYAVSNYTDECDIRIGSAGETVEGDVQYVISYTYDIGPDRLTGADEFYYNIIGTDWDTTIESVSFAVHFPKEFQYNGDTLGFTHGYAGGGDYSDVAYKVEENTVYGTYDQPLSAYQGLTMRLTLPNRYFVRSGGMWDVLMWVCRFLPLAFFVLMLLVWLRSRSGKPVETVEFYPPEELDPLSVGLIYDGKADRKDITSLLIYLANLGCLSIRETGKKDYEIVLLQQYAGDFEPLRVFYNGLKTRSHKNQQGERIVTRSDLKKHFYITVDRVRDEMEEPRVTTQYFLPVRRYHALALVLSFLSLCAVVFAFFYGQFYDPWIAVMPLLFIMILLVCFLPALLVTGGRSGGSVGKMLLIMIGMIFAIMLVFLMMRYGADGIGSLLQAQNRFVLGGIAAIIGMLVIGFRMHPRTLYGQELLSRIMGFRRFLETAEKDRLRLLVEQDPQYFYNVLPYAYVLGVSSKWIARFDEIADAPPTWLEGGDSLNSIAVMDTIDRSMRSFGHAMTSEPHATFSGGSSSGSDWSSSSSSDSSWSSSSSSGGGSSGGGSGGGGGSSW